MLRPGRLYAWLFGIALVAAVVIVSMNLGEGRAFVGLASHVSPSWLGFGIVLQLCTYATDARSWQRVLHRAGEVRRFRGFVGLGLAKLFIDQAVPSGGVGGTLVVVRGLERRGVPRSTCMAAVVVDLYGYYAAYVTGLATAFVVLGARGELGAPIVLTAAIFLSMGLTVVALITVLTTRLQRFVPGRILRLRLLAPLTSAVSEADPVLVRRADLIATSYKYQLVIFILDAATLWTMLRGVGLSIDPAPVFASFMVSSLARSIGFLPGGIGTFEVASVTTLHLVGAPLAPALAATLLFRGLTFWIPLLPGMIMARRESR
jgi:Mg2+-importing ATPase